MKQGELTAQVSRSLSRELQGRDYEVLFDHGDKGVDPPDQLGQIASWFGPDYKTDSRLALLDIAIVRRGTDDALLLVEIEENAASPKVLLGDVLATLLGDHITFQGQRELNVGPWTSLIVLVRSEADRPDAKIGYLVEKLCELKSRMTTSNASIGKVVIDAFSNGVELQEKVVAYIDVE